MFLTILLIILCCYAVISIALSFIFIVFDWENFCDSFDEDERTAAIIVLVIFEPTIIAAALAINLVKPILDRTCWRDDTKRLLKKQYLLHYQKH